MLEALIDALGGAVGRLSRAVGGRLSLSMARLDSVMRRSALADPVALLHRRGQRVDESQNRMQAGMHERLRRLRRSIDAAERLVQRIAPHSFLIRMGRALQQGERRMQSAIRGRLGDCDRRVQLVKGRLDRHAPEHRVAHFGDRLRSVARQIRAGVHHRIKASRDRVDAHGELLAALSYHSVLQRGYSITRIKKGRVVVRAPEQLADGDLLVTESSGGAFESRVVNLDQLELFE
jgi:exodeoxyribonuclease VII large subunit